MADKILSYGGIGVSAATFMLDDTTFNAIKSDLNSAAGKCVALKANNTVGFGASAGSPLFGVILKADMRGVATIQFRGFKEGVGLNETKPAIGDIGLGVDASGNVMKLTAGKIGTVTALNDADATILL